MNGFQCTARGGDSRTASCAPVPRLRSIHSATRHCKRSWPALKYYKTNRADFVKNGCRHVSHVTEPAHAHSRRQFSPTPEAVHTTVRLGSDGANSRATSTENRSESPDTEGSSGEHIIAGPMDLSSGGGGPGGGTPGGGGTAILMAAAAQNSLLNAHKLAEFVRAQQAQQVKQQETTPPNDPATPAGLPLGSLMPKKRVWPELQLDFSAMVKERLRQQAEVASGEAHQQKPQPRATSPADSNSSGSTATPSSANKEVKKRRLDELLSKKFSVNDSPSPPLEAEMRRHEIVNNNPLPARRDSTERKNKRKRASPQISLRPNSDLLQEEVAKKLPKTPDLDALRQLHIPTSLPPVKPPKPEVERPKPVPAAVEEHDEESKNSLKSQILQLHLAQAALLNNTPVFPGGLPGFPGLPGLPGASTPGAASAAANPLLYYGYYAQMIQGLQSQQQKLLEQLTRKQTSPSPVKSSSPASLISSAMN